MEIDHAARQKYINPDDCRALCLLLVNIYFAIIKILRALICDVEVVRFNKRYAS